MRTQERRPRDMRPALSTSNPGGGQGQRNRIDDVAALALWKALDHLDAHDACACWIWPRRCRRRRQA